MEYSVTALSLGNEVHGSVVVVFIREEFVRMLLKLPRVVGIADEYPDASEFPRAGADEFANRLWIGVDILLGSPILYILSVAGGKIVPSMWLTSALVMGALVGDDDIDGGLEYDNGLSVAL